MAKRSNGPAGEPGGFHVFRYRQLAGEIEKRILDGTYQPGEKLPSIRRLHRQSNLSISTVFQAYMELESTGLVEARDRSGYYVLPVSLQRLEAPVPGKTSSVPQRVTLAPVINSVVGAISNPRFVPLGNTAMDPALLPVKSFSRILKSINRNDMRAMLSYTPSEGFPDLRRQIALRTLGVLEGIEPDDIIITNGCTEAVALSLLAVTRPGDTVAIEAPTNLTFLQLLKELGLLVAEIATDPKKGVDLAELEKSLRGKRINACLLMPNFQNPLGALMPEGNKKALVDLASRHEIPVIEDDISSQLYFGDQRPVPLKAYDRKGLVLTCSSFSKTLAPGLRLGWVIPGRRFSAKIQRLKAGMTISTSTLDQYIVSSVLGSGAYERHLRVLRSALKKQVFKTALEIQRHFPEQTRLAVPQGGSLLWVQLPPGVDGLSVYQTAFDRNIAIVPGVVCSNSKRFNNYIQIACAAPFSRRIKNALALLGSIVSDLMTDASS
ncbi:MAG: PLP-dependent aminotransferase family protein [Hyphomicrobiales bacterium]